MSFLDKLFNKNKNAVKKPQKSVEEPFDRLKMDQIISYLKENCGQDCVYIDAKLSDSTGIFDSKFGGLPYWDPTLDYPKDSNGKMLVLLAQINFESAGITNEFFPKTGILQFYIAAGDLYGADFDDRNRQAGFRIIYHSSPDDLITEDTVRSLGILPNSDPLMNSDYLPLYKEYSLSFTEGRDCVNGSMDNFEDQLKCTLKTLFNETVEGDVSKAFSRREFDYLFNRTGWGHKMLENPSFTQWDPRTDDHYDALLLQIDSLDGIMWGDTGVANFFIAKDKLKQLDFSDVLYNWDCY